MDLLDCKIEFSTMFIIGAIIFWASFIIGLIAATPDELENGCIFHDNKIYCESKVEDE